MRKLSLVIGSNSRLNKEIISEVICLLPLISPHKPSECPPTQEDFDICDQSSPHSLNRSRQV